MACSGGYTEPTSGPTADIEIASLCTTRAAFTARINGQRTETRGCNETAHWSVVPGHVDLIVNVDESNFTIAPLTISFDIAENECARFLLRQHDGYDLEFFGVEACP